MKLQECSSRAVLVAVVVAWLGSSAWPSGAHAMSFGGQSTGVQATVPAAGVVIKAASGQLPPSGGEVDASAATRRTAHRPPSVVGPTQSAACLPFEVGIATTWRS